jgi:putative hydrolase of the HAD superfamily
VSSASGRERCERNAVQDQAEACFEARRARGATAARARERETAEGTTVIRAIGLDGDDTLWHNESIFSMTQGRYYGLLRNYVDKPGLEDHLFEREMRNLKIFGYGVKGFTLSMIETAIEVTEGRITAQDIQAIVEFGRAMLEHPVELLQQVRPTVEALAQTYQLLLITKGDPYDQESKVARSGMAELFTGIEIVTQEDSGTYRNILRRHGLQPHEFLMAGNSMRSDVLPVVEIGAHAVLIPHHLTWAHEAIEPPPEAIGRYHEIPSIAELPARVLALSGGAALP